jgi:signal transduction histidine kinase
MKAQAMTHEYDACTQAGPHTDFGSTVVRSSDAPSNLLVRVSLALTGPLDERVRVARLAHCLAPALADGCLIELADKQGQLRLSACAAATPEQSAELRTTWERQSQLWNGWTPRQRAFRERSPILVDDELPGSTMLPADLPHEASLFNVLGYRSALIVPIVVQEKIAGAITLVANRPGRFREHTRSCMAEVGRRAVTAIENARLYADERAARAEAEAAIRTRDELTALISHDLRNPLAIVHGQADLLLRQLQQPGLERDRLSRGLHAVRSAAAQMRLLLDDLQDVAHLRAGQPLHLECEQVELLALIRRVVALQQATTTRHTLHLETERP